MLGSIIGGIGNIIGGILGNNQAEKIAQQNIALQREFAQMGIRWKVADAKAAGVHPLYALGASTHSFSPVSVGYQNPLSGLPEMGQSIDRAVTQGSNTDERLAAKLRLENMALQNDVLRAEVASKIGRIGQQVGPSFPGGTPGIIPGQGDSRLIKVVPQEVTAQRADAPGTAPGVNPLSQWFDTGDGGWMVGPSNPLAESIEDQAIPSTVYGLKHYIMPRDLGGSGPPPSSVVPLKPGHEWWYTGFDWRQRPVKGEGDLPERIRGLRMPWWMGGKRG